MKKILSAGMTGALSVLLCTALSFGVLAEETTIYQLGDSVDDFGITTFSGEEVSLNELLEDYDVVLVSAFASWSEATSEQIDDFMDLLEDMEDQVCVLELTGTVWDEVEDAKDIWESQVEPSLDTEEQTIIGGEITDEIAEKFAPTVYPTTYLIDKNQKICFINEGVIQDIDALEEQLSEVYISDAYGESILLEELPEVEYITEEEDETELSEVLTDGMMEVTNPELDPLTGRFDIWSFLFTEEGDAVYPTNLGEAGTIALLEFEFEADAGSLLALDYQMNNAYPDSGILLVTVDDRLEDTIRTVTEDWETSYINIKTSGSHTLYLHYVGNEDEEETLQIRKIRLADDAEAEEWINPTSEMPKTLEEKNGLVELISTDGAQQMLNMEDGSIPQETWIVENSESARIRIQVGEAFNVNTAVVVADTDTDSILWLLKDCEWDENGYYIDIPLTEDSVRISLSNSATEDTEKAILNIYPSVESPALESLDLTNINLDDIEGDALDSQLQDIAESYFYSDGTPLYSDIEAVKRAIGLDTGDDENDAETESEQTETYTLHIRSEIDKPVEGVITQWFDEEMDMHTVVTDANGDAVFTGKISDYTVHILVLPSKYLEVQENLEIEKNQTEQTLVVYYR